MPPYANPAYTKHAYKSVIPRLHSFVKPLKELPPQKKTKKTTTKQQQQQHNNNNTTTTENRDGPTPQLGACMDRSGQLRPVATKVSNGLTPGTVYRFVTSPSELR